jgi:hypothetical protein
LPSEASNAGDAAQGSLRRDASRRDRPEPDRSPIALAATPGDRPENPTQRIEKLESAPGNGFGAEASSAPGGTPFIDPSWLDRIGWPKLRAPLNGVATG